MLRMLDLFSGIGGLSLAAHWLGGFETVAFVEREPYCQRVLRRHWPDVPIFDDVCTYHPKPGSADVICGGFPCQDISVAGKQAGIKEGTRSGLFYELMRIVRLVGPRYVILENVAAITSNGLDTVLGTLAEAGFDAEWACIPAADVGACHRRDRWWCVAYANNAGMEAPRAKQPSAGVEQCGELDAAYANQVRCDRDENTAADGRTKGSIRAHWYVNALASCYRSTDSPHPNRQRQQECQPAAVSGGQGRPCWGDAPRRLNPDWQSYLSEPVLRRGDDGLSGRVDRLRALGNAVVPQVAMVPLQRVLELERSGRARVMA